MICSKKMSSQDEQGIEKVLRGGIIFFFIMCINLCTSCQHTVEVRRNTKSYYKKFQLSTQSIRTMKNIQKKILLIKHYYSICVLLLTKFDLFQREKTKQLQLSDIAPYFELPIAKAAKKLDICATALKGICRKHGVLRWPYRKVSQIILL